VVFLVDPIDEKVLLVVIALAGQNSGLYDFDFIFLLGDWKNDLCLYAKDQRYKTIESTNLVQSSSRNF